MRPATLDMTVAELARSDIVAGLELHIEKAKQFNPSPESIIASGKLFLTALSIKAEGATAKRKWNAALAKLEGLGVEGKSAALDARLELLGHQLEQARLGKTGLVLEDLSDVLGG